MEQLKLYEEMGCHVDTTKAAYTAWIEAQGIVCIMSDR